MEEQLSNVVSTQAQTCAQNTSMYNLCSHTLATKYATCVHSCSQVGYMCSCQQSKRQRLSLTSSHAAVSLFVCRELCQFRLCVPADMRPACSKRWSRFRVAQLMSGGTDGGLLGGAGLMRYNSNACCQQPRSSSWSAKMIGLPQYA